MTTVDERAERLVTMLSKTKSTLDSMRALTSMVDERSDQNLRMATHTTMREVFGVFMAFLAILEDLKDLVAKHNVALTVLTEFVDSVKEDDLPLEVMALVIALAEILAPEDEVPQGT